MSPVDCVVPLLGDSKGSLEVIGSGVLVDCGAKVFLLSATHVFTDNASASIYYPGRNGVETLLGTRFGADRNQEDVTYLVLDDATKNDISSSYAALPVFFIEMSDVTSVGDHYCLTGFPEDIQSIDANAAVFRAQRFAYTSRVAADRIYKKCHVTKTSHIVIEHSKNRALDEDENELKPPSLHCMSGGAVWKHIGRQFSLPGLPAARLVGISIEKHDEWAAAVATRINFPMEAIRKNFPELSNLIPTSSTLNIAVNEK